MSDCVTCPVETRCGYEYKPCDCVGQRKFTPLANAKQAEPISFPNKGDSEENMLADMEVDVAMELICADDDDYANVRGVVERLLAAGYSNTERYNRDVPFAAAFALTEGELKKAVEKFPAWPTDPIHALSVLGEEYGELNKEVLQLTYEPHKTDFRQFQKEAVQTAAMAIRFLASIGRYEFAPASQHAQK